MKALVISDRAEIIEFVTPLLKNKGFDLIHYRWIIKALDNIEEIQPDVIVLSAGEYPRHWKTLAGFVQSGIGGNDVKVYLYETTPLSEEDEKKAEGLGVLQFTDYFGQDAEINERLYTSVQIAYNEPYGAMHFCSGKYYEAERTIEIEDKITNGSYLKYVSMFYGDNVNSFSAVVENETDGITSLKVM